ncbi:hypothetical protein [Actinomadura fibrosa]|uniref:Uncharacterized protein n=1 Tax=Actinomadura fibrosa TaxID=111802 RepID=A0ABW2XUE4_9ACTN|nr:hypothetical protein [Actinomadura fibrosa]
MRIRTAVASVGIAVTAVAGLSAPAQAASWKSYGGYTTKSKCIDAGQQYVREGFNEYKCTYAGPAIYPPYTLWLR